MWTIFKVSTEFATVLLLFSHTKHVGSSLLNQESDSTPALDEGVMSHWAAREVPLEVKCGPEEVLEPLRRHRVSLVWDLRFGRQLGWPASCIPPFAVKLHLSLVQHCLGNSSPLGDDQSHCVGGTEWNQLACPYRHGLKRAPGCPVLCHRVFVQLRQN